jgi:hypothetical protein
MTRSQILAQPEVPANRRTVKALRNADTARLLWFANDTFKRFDDIAQERLEIRRIIRRLNRRHRRMCGLSLKGA